MQKKELEERRNSILNRNKHQHLNHVESVRELEYLKDYVGKYADIVPETFEERRELLTIAINNLLNDTERGAIPKGKTLAVSKDWAKKLISSLDRMDTYFENIGKEPHQYDEVKSTDLQGLFKRQFLKDDGVTANKEDTLIQYRKQYKFINTLENVLFATDRDYTSGLMTPQELENIGVNIEIKAPKTEGPKWYKEEDYQKLERRIYKECGGDLTKATDIHIAVLLSRKWGVRFETTEQLNISELRAKDGTIRVPADKNKSGVPYKAITLDEDGKKILGAIVQRAIENGHDTVITAKKDSIYRSFKRLERRAGVNVAEYKGQKFHALRRAFADELYERYRKNGYYDDREGCKTLVNTALGHNYKELKNLSCYVRDMW